MQKKYPGTIPIRRKKKFEPLSPISFAGAAESGKELILYKTTMFHH